MSDALHEGWSFEVVDVPKGGVRIGRIYAENGSLRAATVFMRMAAAATRCEPSGTLDGMPFWDDDATSTTYSSRDGTCRITLYNVDHGSKRVMMELVVPTQALEMAGMQHHDALSSARSTATYGAHALAQMSENTADHFLEGLAVLCEEHDDVIGRGSHDLHLPTPWSAATCVDRGRPTIDAISVGQKEAIAKNAPKNIAILLDDIGTKGMRITIAPYAWKTDVPALATATMRAVADLPESIRTIFGAREADTGSGR
jgi:hypothetical protein